VLENVAKKDYELRTAYLRMEERLSSSDRDESRRKRMIYRSKQRGWLEVDLLLGSWAVDNIPKMTSSELDEYDVLLEEETIDIFNYINKKVELPPHLKGLGVMAKLQEHSYAKTIDDPSKYKDVKRRTNLT
jgi:succinate dehydrogenase assembly factor 2